MKFWILWGLDAVIALVVLYFFVAGLMDGSVSSFNGGLWAGILLAVAAILGGGILLRSSGHPVLAAVVLSILAVPGALYAIFMLLILVMKPRWN
jgi:hypothetical protein